MRRLFLLLALFFNIQCSCQDKSYIPKMDYPIQYNGFVVDWDTIGRIPKMVYYTVVWDSLQSFGRTSFGTDESIINPSYTYEYTNTGYDRGHMMPSASAQTYDMWEDCYWMTNIAPQLPDLNRRVWKNIETFERNNSDPKIYIIVGSIGSDGEFETGINIPHQFYKIIYNEYYDMMIAFLCTQNDGYKSIDEVVISVDEVEKLTGIDFFSNLSRTKQKLLESHSDINKWYR